MDPTDSVKVSFSMANPEYGGQLLISDGERRFVVSHEPGSTSTMLVAPSTWEVLGSELSVSRLVAQEKLTCSLNDRVICQIKCPLTDGVNSFHVRFFCCPLTRALTYTIEPVQESNAVIPEEATRHVKARGGCLELFAKVCRNYFLSADTNTPPTRLFAATRLLTQEQIALLNRPKEFFLSLNLRQFFDLFLHLSIGIETSINQPRNQLVKRFIHFACELFAKLSEQYPDTEFPPISGEVADRLTSLNTELHKQVHSKDLTDSSVIDPNLALQATNTLAQELESKLFPDLTVNVKFPDAKPGTTINLFDKAVLGRYQITYTGAATRIIYIFPGGHEYPLDRLTFSNLTPGQLTFNDNASSSEQQEKRVGHPGITLTRDKVLQLQFKTIGGNVIGRVEHVGYRPEALQNGATTVTKEELQEQLNIYVLPIFRELLGELSPANREKRINRGVTHFLETLEPNQTRMCHQISPYELFRLYLLVFFPDETYESLKDVENFVDFMLFLRQFHEEATDIPVQTSCKEAYAAVNRDFQNAVLTRTLNHEETTEETRNELLRNHSQLYGQGKFIPEARQYFDQTYGAAPTRALFMAPEPQICSFLTSDQLPDRTTSAGGNDNKSDGKPTTNLVIAHRNALEHLPTRQQLDTFVKILTENLPLSLHDFSDTDIQDDPVSRLDYLAGTRTFARHFDLPRADITDPVSFLQQLTIPQIYAFFLLIRGESNNEDIPDARDEYRFLYFAEKALEFLTAKFPEKTFEHLSNFSERIREASPLIRASEGEVLPSKSALYDRIAQQFSNEFKRNRVQPHTPIPKDF